MAPASSPLRLDSIVGPFAEMLLAADLPDLAAERRAEVVRFVQRRTSTVPSFTRFGITVIGLFYKAVARVPGGQVATRFLIARPLPLLGEYPRLVRSLGYAYIWERWPDTHPSGAPS
ncbi:MAG TPA: hypothetical protein VGC84_18345 [Ilumatobacteraceae bacterium]|jgi:hypothetical protein